MSSSLWVTKQKSNSIFVGAKPGHGFHGATYSQKKKKHGWFGSHKRHKHGNGHINDVDSRGLPLIVKAATRYVERCLNTEGLYRVSGNKTRVQKIYGSFKAGHGAAIPFKKTEVHAWTGMLKHYLREQAEPLLTYKLFDSFIDIANVQKKEMELHFLQVIISNLPKENKLCIAHLMLHLYEVQARQKDNLMDCDNLGVVFGPTLLRPKVEDMEYIKKVPLGNKVVALMIEYSQQLFPIYKIYDSKKREERRRRNHPPHIVTSVIEYLESGDKLLETDGLYRVSGSKEIIDNLKYMCIRGEKVTQMLIEEAEPHVATGLLKQYLRELPEPLIPFGAYHEFVLAGKNAVAALSGVGGNKTDIVSGTVSDVHDSGEIFHMQYINDTAAEIAAAEGLHDAVASLPDLNRRTLRIIIRHLVRVEECKDSNRMTSENLSVVFGPTCLRPLHETTATMISGDDRCVIKALIDLAKYVFPQEEDSDNEDTGFERASKKSIGNQKKDFVVPYTPNRFSARLRKPDLYDSSSEDEPELDVHYSEPPKPERALPCLPTDENDTPPSLPARVPAKVTAAVPRAEESLREKVEELTNDLKDARLELEQWRSKCLSLEKTIKTISNENDELNMQVTKYKEHEKYSISIKKKDVLPPGMIHRAKLGSISGIVEEDEEEEEDDDDSREDEIGGRISFDTFAKMDETKKEIKEVVEKPPVDFDELLKITIGGEDEFSEALFSGVLASPKTEEKKEEVVIKEEEVVIKEEEGLETNETNDGDNKEVKEAEIVEKEGVVEKEKKPEKQMSRASKPNGLTINTSSSETQLSARNVTQTPRQRPAPPVPKKPSSKPRESNGVSNKKKSLPPGPPLALNKLGGKIKPPPPQIPRKPANVHSSLKRKVSIGGSTAKVGTPPPPGLHKH